MQTVYQVAAGSAHTENRRGSCSTRPHSPSQHGTRNRIALLFTSAPLFALLAFVGISGIVQTRAQAREAGTHWGQLSAPQAREEARLHLARVLNVAPDALSVQSAAPQEGILLRRKGHKYPSARRAWYVTLSTDTAQYLVRLNADSKQVYSINRFPTDIADRAPGTVTSSEALPASSLVSRQEGELRVRQCLRDLGIAPGTLAALPPRALHSDDKTPGAVPVWEFAYRCPTPGWGSRMLRICIDRRTGDVENVWHPAAVLTVS